MQELEQVNRDTLPSCVNTFVHVALSQNTLPFCSLPTHTASEARPAFLLLWEAFSDDQN